MGFLQWISNNWFVLLQSAGISGGLLLTTVSLRDDVKARRVTNLIYMTQHHREIWSQLYTRPELSRVLDPSVNVKLNPVTKEEELFISLLILHLNSSFQAMKVDVLVKPEGLRRDVHMFFSLPVPKAVWETAKTFQDEDFVRFVEMHRAGN